ncbi:MAG: hypothetical protein K9N06_08470 [Candidatus Cloacimonetes bacterium]|nr:hypothetical protein [Candidatus Cloacimonadota bacterium]
MKAILALFVMLMLVNVLTAEPIDPNQGFHFTGELGIYLVSDLIMEWANLGGWYRTIPVGLALSVGFSKELFMDKRFSWEDILVDCSGISFGFLLRIK